MRRRTGDGEVLGPEFLILFHVFAVQPPFLRNLPNGESLIAEVQIKNADSGFIHTNQPVKVKVASYPFQKYGMLEG